MIAHPSTFGTYRPTDPLSDPNLPLYVRDSIIEERVQYAALCAMADGLLAYVAQHPRLWDMGDGYGGGVHVAIQEAAERRGLQTGPPPNPKARKPISGRLRTAVYERDEYRCRGCGTHEKLNIDHIVPVSRGGTNDFDNLQTLCGSCNSRKGVK